MSVSFSNKLIDWYNQNKRDLPWRKTKNPYKIWVSEIILQQTRIEFGTKYYSRFLKKYPNVRKLANSSDRDLMKIWEGLGYYSRAINMLKTAKIILNSYNGVFPSKYDQLIQLPGIGDYTASAISSICDNELQPVVDGNVLRFLSRMHKIDLPIESIKTKKYFKKLGFKLKWVGKGINEKAINIENNLPIIECNKRYLRPVEVDFLKGNAQKAKKKLNWSPKISIDDLIDEMIQNEL